MFICADSMPTSGSVLYYTSRSEAPQPHSKKRKRDAMWTTLNLFTVAPDDSGLCITDGKMWKSPDVILWEHKQLNGDQPHEHD